MVGHLVSQNGIFGIRNLRGQKPRGFVWPIQGCSCCQGLQTRANPKMSCSSAICSNAIPADQVKLDVYSPLHVGLGLFPGVLRRRWLSAQRWTKCCEPHNVRGPPASAACAIPTRFLVFGQFCWFCCSIIPKWSKKKHGVKPFGLGQFGWSLFLEGCPSCCLQTSCSSTSDSRGLFMSLQLICCSVCGFGTWNPEPHLKTGS